MSLLVDLWNRKISSSGGRPFDIGQDIHHALLDMITRITYGVKLEQTQLVHELANLNSTAASDAASADSVVEFESAKLDEELAGLVTLAESLRISLRSPIPKLHFYFIRKFLPYMKDAISFTNRMREREIAARYRPLQKPGA